MALSAGSETFTGTLASASAYKPAQGRLVRAVVGVSVLVVFVLLGMALHPVLSSQISKPGAFGVGTAIALVGVWFSFRIINYPRFAEFLIEVEAELRKVSWITFADLKRCSFVVIVFMLLLSMLLFSYDVIWHAALRLLGILQF